MLALVDLEERVPKDHPLRTIKAVADEALERLSAEFDRMYSKVGRASVPPERLLKASLLISLYSVRSERAFCEELEYNLLFRWFLDMNLMERSFDPTVFTKNRRRLLEHRVGQALFDEVLLEADRQGLLSDEHFSVDGTLIEAAEDVIARNLYVQVYLEPYGRPARERLQALVAEAKAGNPFAPVTVVPPNTYGGHRPPPGPCR